MNELWKAFSELQQKAYTAVGEPPWELVYWHSSNQWVVDPGFEPTRNFGEAMAAALDIVQRPNNQYRIGVVDHLGRVVWDSADQ